ncbi:excalibur calcium-binding domain-containing protein [Kineococcus sp. TRM81007]|uniref:excalibur calcium-binding domain-containing protein n=1 Tax=Kineococcus sp. TRM81007 TaxID=2925831 RepID=UPI001F5665FA|nr:excalibur calcium-binding domain-containing protein [Kineococcus sp. TRM81007]MCI2238102.1 excalibur calcium-binding domain-containing protein [Kineococcus sp. TRM81007]
MTRARKLTLAGVGVGCLVLFGACGAGLGALGDDAPTPAVTRTVAASPLPTVTSTAAAEPVVITAPPETSTAPAPPPVTAPAPTVYVDAPAAPEAGGDSGSGSGSGGGAVYYANCTAVRAAGADPIRAGDPGYSSKLDRDGDGIGCE